MQFLCCVPVHVIFLLRSVIYAAQNFLHVEIRILLYGTVKVKLILFPVEIFAQFTHLCF